VENLPGCRNDAVLDAEVPTGAGVPLSDLLPSHSLLLVEHFEPDVVHQPILAVDEHQVSDRRRAYFLTQRAVIGVGKAEGVVEHYRAVRMIWHRDLIGQDDRRAADNRNECFHALNLPQVRMAVKLKDRLRLLCTGYSYSRFPISQATTRMATTIPPNESQMLTKGGFYRLVNRHDGEPNGSTCRYSPRLRHRHIRHSHRSR
jgi:hypothetical protein